MNKVDCPICNGTGEISGCPVPKDQEPNCDGCDLCKDDGPCKVCEGTGELTETEYQFLMKWKNRT